METTLISSGSSTPESWPSSGDTIMAEVGEMRDVVVKPTDEAATEGDFKAIFSKAVADMTTPGGIRRRPVFPGYYAVNVRWGRVWPHLF